MGMSQTRRDLGEHLVRELEGLLSRHFEIAREVLPADEIADLAVKTAHNVALGMIGIVIQFAKREELKGVIFDLCVDELTQRLPLQKQAVLGRIAEEQAKMRRAERR